MAAWMLRKLTEGTGGTATIDNTNLEARSIASPPRAATTTPRLRLGRHEARWPPSPDRRPLKRPGLHASARKGYVEPNDKAEHKAQAQAKPKAGGPRAARSRSYSAGHRAAGLPLSVHAVAWPGASRNVSVVIEVGCPTC